MQWIRPQRTITPSFLDEADCVVCNRDLFLSAIVCEACGRVACGHHAGSVCECGGNKKIVYRTTPQELKDLAFVCCKVASDPAPAAEPAAEPAVAALVAADEAAAATRATERVAVMAEQTVAPMAARRAPTWPMCW